MIDKEVLDTFKDRSVVVTGGTGLIGRQVVDVLAGAGARVTVVSLDRLKLNKKARYVYADLTELGNCKRLTHGADFVFHLAGIKGSIEVTKTKPASHFVPALMFNTNILEACRINGVKKAVYTSSIGAYSSAEVFRESENTDGPPMDFYAGWAKRMAEFQIKTYDIQYGLKNFAIVRPCNVYGPGDNFNPDNAMVIPSLIRRIHNKENPVVIWGDGSAIRDFAYSRDIAEGAILALYHGTAGGFVNLGSGEGVSIKQLVETLRSFIDFNYVFDPEKPSGFPKRVMDISLAKKLIDYRPSTDLKDGLKMTWEWFLKNAGEYRKKHNYFGV